MEATEYIRRVFASLLAGVLLHPVMIGAVPQNQSYDRPATPIRHLVIIFQENISFDHYFGTYPHVPKLNSGFARIARMNGGDDGSSSCSCEDEITAGAALLHQASHKEPVLARPALDPNSLTPFVDPLPVPQLAKSTGMRPNPANVAVKIPYYRLAMSTFETKVHRDMKPARVWGFGGTFPGPTFDLPSGQEVLVEWANELPQEHLLPIDYTLHGAERDKPQVRAVSHLHGAKVPPHCDGYPEDWLVAGKSAIFHYPNQQDAAMLWYHDYARGMH
jgi:Phosphoesterase family/Multicopper oxidase